jgi:hypothetical protein
MNIHEAIQFAREVNARWQHHPAKRVRDNRHWLYVEKYERLAKKGNKNVRNQS